MAADQFADVDGDPCDLVELSSLAPLDLSRVVQAWPAERLRSRQAPRRAREQAVRRVGTLAAAAVVVAAVGAGLALAAPAGMTPLREAVACDQKVQLPAAGGTAAGPTPRSSRDARSAHVALAAPGPGGLTGQLLDASGRPITRPVSGAATLAFTWHDLCPGRRWNDVAAPGTRVRLVVEGSGDQRQCLVAPLSGRGALVC